MMKPESRGLKCCQTFANVQKLLETCPTHKGIYGQATGDSDKQIS